MIPLTADFDIDGDASIFNLLNLMVAHSATLVNIDLVGPAGGNPNLTFSFQTEDDMKNFTKEIAEDEDLAVMSIVDLDPEEDA